MGGPPIIELFRERYGLTGSTEDLIAEKDRAYLDLAAGGTRVFAPIRELILAFLLQGLRLGIATSSRRTVLDAVLVETGLAPVFAATVSSDDVNHPKPEPDAFLLTARRLKVSPENCCVIEDSQYGVQAAVAAGMSVIAVPAPGHEFLRPFGTADLVVTGGANSLQPGRILSALGLSAVVGLPAISEFRRTVYEHYRRHGRTMSWRETADPYEVLVSEVMLQQTQADRVEPKYREFLETFPTVERLAGASLQEVLQRWQGLGYNRRAKYLHDAAGEIVNRFNSAVPDSTAELRTLPGVGPYTAGAIMAFAFNSPEAFIETNIRRTFLHIFFPGRESVSDREILRLIAATLDSEDPRNWYYALMDYGTHLATLFRNANRRSAHYQRQASFAGSVREVRGAIVRVLTAESQMERLELQSRVAPGDARFSKALAGLVRDGMVSVAGNLVNLA